MVEFFRKKIFSSTFYSFERQNVMIKYISIIKDSDKGLFRYMKKYSNNFSLLSQTITLKLGEKDQFYGLQEW